MVDTGPYASIRHPGYAGMLLFTVGVPALLGSLWDVSGTFEVMGTESVTVTAGTFDALKIANTYSLTDNSGNGFSRDSTATSWWVNGLGVVKVTDQDDSGRTWESRELQSYSVFSP